MRSRALQYSIPYKLVCLIFSKSDDCAMSYPFLLLWFCQSLESQIIQCNFAQATLRSSFRLRPGRFQSGVDHWRSLADAFEPISCPVGEAASSRKMLWRLLWSSFLIPPLLGLPPLR